ncbi:MAG: sortase, partial [Actinobacteria bacterium]|nr:sortase [Actinomycetota bacterium]
LEPSSLAVWWRLGRRPLQSWDRAVLEGLSVSLVTLRLVIDEIETAIGTHVYVVRDSFVVKPTDVWVTDDRESSWLTLTTCHPKFSARERLIITAELVEGPNVAYISLLLEAPPPTPPLADRVT